MDRTNPGGVTGPGSGRPRSIPTVRGGWDFAADRRVFPGFAAFQNVMKVSSQVKLILSRIRIQEAVIFQSPAVLGLAMFLPVLSVRETVDALLACIGSFLIAASILAINDWADINLDTQNTLKRSETFVGMGIHPRQMLALAVSLAVAGTGLFAVLSMPHVVVALLAIIFGLAYSVPVGGLRGKSTPVFSSFLHFGGTLLAFLLGALTFAPAGWGGLLVASHPAVLITAGHLVHEVEDYEQDRLSGCQTNAVRFGRKSVFLMASLLFALSFLLLYWLAGEGFLPGVLKYSPILYLVYTAIAVQAYQAGLTRDSVRHLRKQYRVLFAVVLLAMLAGSLLSRGIVVNDRIRLAGGAAPARQLLHLNPESHPSYLGA